MNSVLNTLIPLGRYLFALPMAIFGVFHFMGANDMAGMVPSYLPGGVLWVYLTGIALIAAAVSIIIQKKSRLAASLLAVMLLIFVLTMHLPGVMSGGGDQMAIIGLLKDIAMAGGALIYAGTRNDD